MRHATTTPLTPQSPATSLSAGVVAGTRSGAWGKLSALSLSLACASALAHPDALPQPPAPSPAPLDLSIDGQADTLTDRLLARAESPADANARSLSDATSLSAPLSTDTSSAPPEAALTTEDPAPEAGPSRWTTATWQRLGSSLRNMWTRVQTRLQFVAQHPAALTVGAAPDVTLRPRHLLLGAQFITPDSGVRALAGLVRSETGNWWQTHTDRYGSLGSSYSRLSASGVLSSAASLLPGDPAANAAHPYLGASFSSRPSPASRSTSTWRLNADLGVMSLNTIRSGQAGPLGAVASGDRGLDDMVRDMRFRPNVKVSVGYSF